MLFRSNRKWEKAADGTGTRVVTCLINRWKVKINREGLYNVKAYVPKKKGGTQKVKGRVKANIKREVSNLEKGAGKKGQEPEPPRPCRGERLLGQTWLASVRPP